MCLTHQETSLQFVYTVNRGPLMINLKDLKKLNYLDEIYSPQDMDDHDLMFRAHKELGKVCGLYSINFKSDNDWGGTRVDGYKPMVVGSSQE